MPSVAIDKTDGIVVYVSKEAMGASFVTSKSSEMNVAYPDPEDPQSFKETVIPEQFVHSIQSSGKMSSDVSDLYTH